VTEHGTPVAPVGLECAELVELVTTYLDDALSDADRARFEAHLAVCDDCGTFVAQFRETIAALGALPAEPPPAETTAALLAVFRGWLGDRDRG
jgi:anti-sigma factor RsiW